jgi:hypothetical protein
VDLVAVDPIGVQAPEGVLDAADDAPPGGASAAWVVARLEADLRREHDVVPPAPGERLTDDLLGLAGGVDIGGVDEVDACVQGGVDDPDRLAAAGSPQAPNIIAPRHSFEPRRRCVPACGVPCVLLELLGAAPGQRLRSVAGARGGGVLLVGDVLTPRDGASGESSFCCIAMWTMNRFGAAPCQWFSPGSKNTRSPGRITSIGPPSHWHRPTPSVT